MTLRHPGRSLAQDRERDRLLRRLAALLRKRPMTAFQIADATDCAKSTAYARLRGLTTLGFRVTTVTVAGKSGPWSTVYAVQK